MMSDISKSVDYNLLKNNNNKFKSVSYLAFRKYCLRYCFRIRYLFRLSIILAVMFIGFKCIMFRRLNPTHRDETSNMNVYRTYPANSKQFLHVNIVLKRSGYTKTNEKKPWRLLFTQSSYNRSIFESTLMQNQSKLKKYQKVSFVPGLSRVTIKPYLATSGLKHIPKAFRLPAQKKQFIEYAKKNKDAWFLEKKNSHRGITLKNVSDLDYKSGKMFVQEYVQKPFLVDGHKFDIGVYVAITSVNPLRAYWYKGDVGFRFCPSKYSLFNASDVNTYVVKDNYLPAWKVPSLKKFMSNFNFGMKASFDAYVESVGKDTTLMWDEVQNAIADTLVHNEKLMVAPLKNTSSANFFQLIRMDLLIDEDFRVYLLEANQGPNLSAPDKLPHRLLFEQILYNLFSLVGVLTPVNSHFQYQPEDGRKSETPSAKDMIAADKNIAVWPRECASCVNKCDGICSLCMPCLSQEMKDTLFEAYREHLHRGDFRRIFPPAMRSGLSADQIEAVKLDKLSPLTKAQYLWMQGKCNLDVTWCT